MSYNPNITDEDFINHPGSFRDDELWREGDTTDFGDEYDYDEQDYISDVLEYDTYLEYDESDEEPQ